MRLNDDGEITRTQTQPVPDARVIEWRVQASEREKVVDDIIGHKGCGES